MLKIFIVYINHAFGHLGREEGEFLVKAFLLVETDLALLAELIVEGLLVGIEFLVAVSADNQGDIALSFFTIRIIIIK